MCPFSLRCILNLRKSCIDLVIHLAFFQLNTVLDKYTQHKKFKGVRNILEGEADDWLGREAVHRGLGENDLALFCFLLLLFLLLLLLLLLCGFGF